MFGYSDTVTANVISEELQDEQSGRNLFPFNQEAILIQVKAYFTTKLRFVITWNIKCLNFIPLTN
jgi:hypothetical protein